MTNYAVFLEGSNFKLELEGRKEFFGFFATVRVDSPSAEDAKDSAISLISSSPELQEAFRNASEIKPTIEAKVVHELLTENQMKNTGFTFFLMEYE
ncbi:hypothetical protein [Ideonella oryzae]|uniref:DUF1488 family protein n=1 Tax=Ideonella oryzae TaxID=2937441 RepID=A0ABT1BRY0_9BURK|nr:hypothetical protein [Ideonella oryzae]MCO5978679.1 hypothetical protein [Ideonella oryzae]